MGWFDKSKIYVIYENRNNKKNYFADFRGKYFFFCNKL